MVGGSPGLYGLKKNLLLLKTVIKVGDPFIRVGEALQATVSIAAGLGISCRS